MPVEIDAILTIAERWGPVGRSHRKLAHRGSYTGEVWVSPSTFRRVLAVHGLVLPGCHRVHISAKKPWPDWLVWAPNRIWAWDVERHEAFLNRVVMKGHHRRLVAAGRLKLRAA